MRWLISCLILVGVFYSCRAHAELPITPEGVLPYLEAVYSSGDIEAYADLLAADFKFVLEDMKASWDKAADIKGTGKLFEIGSVQISFTKDPAVKPGPQPGTWIIEDVRSGLTVTAKKDGKTRKVENTFSFIIREEEGRMRIVEWRQYPDDQLARP